MLLDREAWKAKFGSRPYLTKGAAAYPAMLNKYLANKLLEAADFPAEKDEQKQADMSLVGRWRNILVRRRSRSRSADRGDRVKVLGSLEWKDP